VRILIADDHPIFRAGLKEILGKDKEVELIGEAENGRQTLQLALKQRWDIVVLDITMPEKDGLEVLTELRRERPKLPVLILSAHPEDQLALRLIKAGASGYLTKDQAPVVLLTAIRKVLRGEKYVSEALAEKVFHQWASDATKPPHETLSQREYQVMSRIAAGKGNKEIAEELFLSVRTVGTYRARVLEKMHMETNADLIRYALQHNLV
jgi:two-component system, NarL family, invasion response regulator UvrY